MTVLRAHFDGKFFVPDDPVDLPAGSPAEIHIEEPSQEEDSEPVIDIVDGLPLIRTQPGAKPITLEDVKGAEDEPW